MLTVYYSDRLEILAEQLAGQLQAPLDPPLATLLMGVQNPGMGYWLQRFLAYREGLLTNLECLDAHTWSRRLCESLIPGLAGPLPWDPAYLAWRVLGGFDGLGGVAEPWLVLDGPVRHRLARQLATCYGGYQLHRPDWLQDWASGAGDHWQARLWQHLGLQDELARLLQQLADGPPASRPRAFWLGLEAPPLPAALLRAVAARIDLHLLVWMPGNPVAPDGPHHPLRQAGLAVEQLTRERLQSLADQQRDCYANASPGTSLLAMLQADILADRARGGSGGLEPRPVGSRDRSVQVHVCHSPMREVEVLYDQLLALFQADPELTPADVLVLTPPGTSYGPLVEAVFGAAEGDRYIPFSVTGEGRVAGLPGAFLALLSLPAEDFSTGPVLAILETDAVRRRFGLGLDDLPLIQRWVATPEIRQALATPAAELSLEPDWQRRLEALLLGYVLGEGQHLPVDGVLPDPAVTEVEAAMLGRLLLFVESLAWLRQWLDQEALPVAHWQGRLEQVLERFFEPTIRDQPGMAVLHQTLLASARDAAAARLTEPVPLMALLEHIRDRLMDRVAGVGAVGSGVSFSTAGLLLGVSAPVICVLGASVTLRATGSPGTLDLLAEEHRRLGAQHDQTGLLRVLLAARKTCYFSYVGRSVHDNRLLPVPAPVDTLLGQLQNGFWVEGGGDLLAQIRSEHPLVCVSRRYFMRSDPLFSYAEELCAVSQIAGHGNAEPRSLVDRPLATPGRAWDAVELERLSLFFRHPTRFLLRERLGLDLDDQPFSAGGLTGSPLAAALLEIYLQGPEPAGLARALRAAGLLPPGELGEAALRRVREQVAPFAGRLREALAETVLNPLELDTTVGGTRLVGRLRGVSSGGLLVFGAGPPRAGDYLDLWLKHLSLNLLASSGVSPVSTWMDPGGGFSLQPVAEPLPILDALLDCYRLGLRQPLHLFPDSALAWARVMRDDQGRLPEEAARRVWEGDGRTPGEEQDPYIRLAFRGEEPLDEQFAQLANRVFGPLLERLRGYGG